MNTIFKSVKFNRDFSLCLHTCYASDHVLKYECGSNPSGPIFFVLTQKNHMSTNKPLVHNIRYRIGIIRYEAGQTEMGREKFVVDVCARY